MDEEIKQEILNVRQELVYMRERILHPEWIDKAGKMIDKLDTIVSRVELPVILPSIQVDEKALRFNFEDDGVNLFWENLFIGNQSPSFQTEVMRNLLRAYGECIEARSK
ncbi:MAG: hypothetical protein IPJ03_16150 [Ignavibacteriales bacterium]|nr:hypothetical protein [Ignavibacteriales bacterium]